MVRAAEITDPDILAALGPEKPVVEMPEVSDPDILAALGGEKPSRPGLVKELTALSRLTPSGLALAGPMGFGKTDQDEGTIAESIYRGVSRGTRQTIGSLSGAAEIVGGSLRNPKAFAKQLMQGKGGQWIAENFGKLLETIGQEGQEWAKESAEPYRMPKEYEGRSLFEEPSMALDPRWIAETTGEALPSVVASVVPGVGAAKGVQIAGKFYKWTPELINRLAKVGLMVGGGATGGMLEGSGTYEEALKMGMPPEEAREKAYQMAAASTGLNALSLGKMFQGNPAKAAAWRKLVHWFTAGATEAVTEAAEEPAEALILGTDVIEAMKRGVNVMPASFLLGAGGSIAAGGSLDARPDVEVEAPGSTGQAEVAETEPTTMPPPEREADTTVDRTTEPPAPPLVSPEMAAELSREKFTPETKISEAVTLDEAVERVSRGDETVLPDIAEGVKQHGPLAMQDEIINGAITKARQNGTQKAMAKIEPELRKTLKQKTVAEIKAEVKAKKLTDEQIAGVAVRQQEETPKEVVQKATEAAPANTAKALKEQKQYLIENIDEAIKTAPEQKRLRQKIDQAEGLKNESTVAYKKAQGAQALKKPFEDDFKRSEELTKQAAEITAGIPSVTIAVPNDGTFTVYNDKATLRKFKEVVSKQFPTTPVKEQGVPKAASTKPSGVRAPSTLSEGLAITMPDGTPAYTNGHILMLGTTKALPTEIAQRWGGEDAESVQDTREKLSKQALDLLNQVQKDAKNKVSQVVFVSRNLEPEELSVSKTPIYGDRHSLAVMIPDKGDEVVTVTAQYYQHAKQQYPQATFKVGNELDAVVVYDKDKAVGLIMPMRSDEDADTLAREFAAKQKAGGIKTETPKRTGSKGTAEQGGYAERPRKGLESPEILELAKEINEGKYPIIRERMKNLGVFRARGAEGRIELRADIFFGEVVRRARIRLKSGEAMTEKVEEFKAKVIEETGLPQDKIVVKHERDRQTGDFILKAYEKDPTLAPKVLAHEIGHLADWLPDKDLRRGNILGRVGSLNRYLKQMIEATPDQKGTILSDEDRKTLRKQAQTEIMGPKWHWSQGSTKEQRQVMHARYKELVGKEKAFRNLISRPEIMTELKAITQIWKPFDEKGNENYTKLRYSGKELYADAVSIMLNEPDLMRKVAPKFTSSWLAYLERKPEVMKMYDELQDRMNNPAAIREHRIVEIYEMWKRGEVTRAELNERLRGDIKGAKDTLLHWLVDRNQEALTVIRKQEKQGIQEGRDARFALEETENIASRVQDYLLGMSVKILRPMKQAGLSEQDVATHMMLRRVAEERTTIANPLGHTPETARDTLAELKKQLGAEKYQTLEKIVSDYRTIRETEVYPEVKESGMWSEELSELVKGRKVYAKFSVTRWMDKKFGKGASAKIYKQIGTLSEIESPFLATIMQDMSLLRAAKINQSKREIVASLKQANLAVPATMKWSHDIGGRIAVEPKDPKLGLMTFMVNGKPEHYYISKPIAETFERSPFQATKIAELWQLANRPIRDILVSKNPIWMTRNIIRDTLDTIKNNPEIRLRDVPKFLGYYKQALPEVWRDVMKGERSEDVSEAARTFATVAQRHYGAREETLHTEIERIAEDFELNFTDHVKREGIRGKLADLYDYLDKLGRVSEQTSKIAGFKYLKHEARLSPRELAHRVRVRVGTPDIKRQGSLHMFTNNVFLFSNVNKEGIRRMVESFNQDRAAYVWKTVAMNMVSKAILMAAAFMSDDVRKIMAGISTYDKRMHTIIPLGLTERGKSVYLRLPEDYEGQVFGAITYDLATGNVKQAVRDAAQTNPYGWNPLIQVGMDLWSFHMNGMNPIDDWRGRPIIPRVAFEAGGKEAQWAMGKHVWRSLGLRLFYEPAYDELVKETTPVEEILKTLPLSVLGTFLKISDAGKKETLSEVGQEVRSRRARKTLDVQSAIKQSINSQKGVVNAKEVRRLYGELVDEGAIDRREKTPNQFLRQYKRIQSGVAARPEIDAIYRATSNEEKARKLRQLKQSMSRSEYENLLRQLRAEGAVSRNVKYHLDKLNREEP
jgi:hypothetical protein